MINSATSLALYCSPMGNTNFVCPMQSQCLTLPLAFAYGKSHSMAPSEEEVQTAIRHRALLAHPMGCNVNKFLELF